jgi:hypothetical protein
MSIPRNLGAFADNVASTGKLNVAGINATGTPSSTTALLGDGSWGTVTTSPSGSTGQLQINNAGAFGAVSSGTSGQVLTSAGSGATPTWSTPSAGAMVYLSTVTASSSSTVDIETTFDSTYDVYLLVASGITPSTSNSVVAARLKIGGSYLSSGTYPAFRMQPESSANSFAGSGDTAATEIRIIGNVGNASNASANFSMYIYSPSSTTLSKMIVWTGASVDTSTYVRLSYGAGFNTGTAAMTGIRFFLLSGNINSGTFRLYGIKNS